VLVPFFFEEDQLENAISLEETEDLSFKNKTYKIDFETGEIVSNFIDETEATLQFIIKTIKTQRDKYLIYSSDVGSELSYLFNESYSQEYLELEVPRLIEEALLIDDRILDINDFVILKVFDELHISFSVLTDTQEEISVEVTL